MKTLDDIKLDTLNSLSLLATSTKGEAVLDAIDHLHAQGLLMVWNTDMDSAPKDDFIIVKGGTWNSESTGLESYDIPFKGSAVVEWNKYDKQWRGCDCINFVYKPTAWMPIPKGGE